MDLKNYLIQMHKFFLKESTSFMKGTNRVKYYLKYPFAYLKFMYYSLKDYKPSNQKQ